MTYTTVCAECGEYITDNIHFQVKLDCGRMCGNQEPYGFVPEVGVQFTIRHNVAEGVRASPHHPMVEAQSLLRL